MARVLLLHLDGKIPNIALMRLAWHHRQLGDEVELRRADNPRMLEKRLSNDLTSWNLNSWDFVYGSLIFERTKPMAERLRERRPDVLLGGTGWDVASSLETYGITTNKQDYTIYPTWQQSIGFSQRGCRLKCSFCVVPRKEGDVQEVQTIWDIWRGEPWPREILLLDNDFFGQPNWQKRIDELIQGGFKVSFNQGINARMLTDETAAAIASVDYRDDSMKTKRIYTAWDNQKDETRLFRGLEALVKHGVRPYQIMVYILIGYWKGETHENRDFRRRRLREFGAIPYPMPFVRSKELVGFQRWVIGAYDKRVPWDEWEKARYMPTNMETLVDPITGGKTYRALGRL
mgnify:CR=1 FL=1